jgi:hypothetical protein
MAGSTPVKNSIFDAAPKGTYKLIFQFCVLISREQFAYDRNPKLKEATSGINCNIDTRSPINLRFFNNIYIYILYRLIIYIYIYIIKPPTRYAMKI